MLIIKTLVTFVPLENTVYSTIENALKPGTAIQVVSDWNVSFVMVQQVL